MKRTHPKIDYGAALSKLAEFPGNPMASNVISDRLQALPGEDMLSNTIREAAQNGNLTGAIKLVLGCVADNKRMARETCGAGL